MSSNCRSQSADTDEVEAERAADEASFDEAADAAEPLAYADGRADRTGEEAEVENEEESEEEIEIEVGYIEGDAEAEEADAEAEEADAEAEEADAEAEEADAEAEEADAEAEEADAEAEEAEAEAEEAEAEAEEADAEAEAEAEEAEAQAEEEEAQAEEAEAQAEEEEAETKMRRDRMGRALHCMNQIRLFHHEYPPLISSDVCSVAAERLAKQIADREAEEGPTSKLWAYLSKSEALLRKQGNQQVELLLEPDDGLGKMMGLIVSRMEFDDFESLPEDSVTSWYNTETPISDLAASEKPEDQMRFRHFAQLLDDESEYTGWGAAQVGTSNVAYVVAVFDQVAMDSEYPLISLPYFLEHN